MLRQFVSHITARPGLMRGYVRACAFAVAAVTVMAGLRVALDPVLGDHYPFAPFVAAIFLAAWHHGWPSGVLALVLSVLTADYLFIEPRGTIGGFDTAHAVGLLVYGVIGAGMIGLVETLRKTQAALRAAKGELERRVEAGTAELTAAVGGLRREGAARQQAEAAARRLAALVAWSDDGIVGLALDGSVTDWNHGAERLFGYPANEMVGRSIFDLLPAAEREQAAGTLDRLRRGEPVPPYEASRVRKDGSRVSVSVRLSPIRDGEAVTGASLIYRDLTEAKRLEEQLRQAQKMEAVGQLAGGVAHDFNNLLTVINGFSEMLLAGLPADDPRRGPVDEVFKAGERAAMLTRQLLAFSRKEVIEPRVLDLNAVVAGAVKMLRRLIGENIRLETAPAADLDRVTADPGQVEQVVMNLAVNARDAMPHGGRLTVETANVELDEAYAAGHAGVRPGRYVLLAVTDTGTGMTPEVQARVFEPFFTTKGVGKGTGLGLATVFGIVQGAGGHVGVYSEVGRGTTFKVYLPSAGRADAADVPVGTRAAPPTGSGKVLVVEDDPQVRALTMAALESLGYRVLEARGGAEALRVSAGHPGPIDLLVTDVVMPGMNGRQVAEHLRRGRPSMRVLYVSGYTDDAVVRHGVLAADAAFLQKPFTLAALAEKVRAALGRPPRAG